MEMERQDFYTEIFIKLFQLCDKHRLHSSTDARALTTPFGRNLRVHTWENSHGDFAPGTALR